MEDFWHTMNSAFSDGERQAFNEWRMNLYTAAELAKSAANHLPDEERFRYAGQKASETLKLVSKIPVMFGA